LARPDQPLAPPGPQHRLRSSAHGIFLLGSTAQRLCLLYDSNPADLVWVVGLLPIEEALG